jgi:hypothetical protein
VDLKKACGKIVVMPNWKSLIWDGRSVETPAARHCLHGKQSAKMFPEYVGNRRLKNIFQKYIFKK